MSINMSDSSTSTFFKTKDVSDGINRISCDISYTEFFERFMAPNVPCIINEDITKSWLSRKHWVSGNKPNFQYLQEKFGNIVAPVANCNVNYYGSQKKDDMLISEFLIYWKDYILKSYPSDMPILYLKDWHLKRDFPSSNYYQVPSYFASDWLNEFWSQKNDICDDYRFVYMGPKGSWTPEHTDVFSSYSWSANIVGRKRWLLYPPTKTNELQDGPCSLDEQVDGKQKVMEVIQETGEVIFVPSGWRHEVFNLEDTISINHNWVNGCNVGEWMWPSLNSALSAVEAELQDCLKEGMDAWEEHCQVLLRATHGIDFVEFYAFLRALGEPRIHFLLSLKCFSDADFVIQPSELRENRGDKDGGLSPEALVEENLETDGDDSGRDFKGAKEESLSLCYKPFAFKVVRHDLSDISSSQKVIELKKQDMEEVTVVEDLDDESQGTMLCENGWCLGMLHALYDVWRIQHVMTSFLSHHCLPKLEFFQNLNHSQSHLRFMHDLNVLIRHAEACGILKQLYKFT